MQHADHGNGYCAECGVFVRLTSNSPQRVVIASGTHGGISWRQGMRGPARRRQPRDQRVLFVLILSARRREARVVGLTPSSSAAPP